MCSLYDNINQKSYIKNKNLIKIIKKKILIFQKLLL